MQPEGRGAVGEQRVVERAERERLALLRLPVLPQLEQHQLAGGVDEIRRIEGAALRLPACVPLLEERLLAKEPNALLHRHVFSMQLYPDDETGKTDQRFGELTEPHPVLLAPEARF